VYIDVLRWTVITAFVKTAFWSSQTHAAHPRRRARLLPAGRPALTGLHPLQQSGFAIAYGPADLDVRGAVAAHASLGQPGEADLEKFGRFLGREEYDDRCGSYPLR